VLILDHWFFIIIVELKCNKSRTLTPRDKNIGPNPAPIPGLYRLSTGHCQANNQVHAGHCRDKPRRQLLLPNIYNAKTLILPAQEDKGLN
jgi:hypothetical protein